MGVGLGGYPVAGLVSMLMLVLACGSDIPQATKDALLELYRPHNQWLQRLFPTSELNVSAWDTFEAL